MLEAENMKPQIFYSCGPLKGQLEEFPKPSDGLYKPKTDLLYSRK